MRILQVNTFESGGGAEVVARGLHTAYRKLNHQAWLAAGRFRGQDICDGFIAIDPALGGGPWRKTLLALANRIENVYPMVRGAGFLRLLARPKGLLSRLVGFEDFDFTSTEHLDSILPAPPDIVQFHNLHGGYINLEGLARLATRIPIVLTLHDCWPFTGHCAHPFSCAAWKCGCGNCPDLTIPPSIAKDRTAANWRRKQSFFKVARPFVAVPSQWLAQQVKESLLSESLQDLRIIHNGVHDCFFLGYEKQRARRELGLPDRGEKILLFAANTVRQNIWKDFQTLRGALGRLSRMPEANGLVFVALGEHAPSEQIGNTKLIFVEPESDPSRVALYYRASDVYVHAAKAETFSLTIAEAMASGLPVVATGVGAVPERIVPLDHPTLMHGQVSYSLERATGLLTDPGDSTALADAVAALLSNPTLSERLGRNARELACRDYTIAGQTQHYLDWFAEIIAKRAP